MIEAGGLQTCESNGTLAHCWPGVGPAVWMCSFILFLWISCCLFSQSQDSQRQNGTRQNVWGQPALHEWMTVRQWANVLTGRLLLRSQCPLGDGCCDRASQAILTDQVR